MIHQSMTGYAALLAGRSWRLSVWGPSSALPICSSIMAPWQMRLALGSEFSLYPHFCSILLHCPTTPLCSGIRNVLSICLLHVKSTPKSEPNPKNQFSQPIAKKILKFPLFSEVPSGFPLCPCVSVANHRPKNPGSRTHLKIMIPSNKINHVTLVPQISPNEHRTQFSQLAGDRCRLVHHGWFIRQSIKCGGRLSRQSVERGGRAWSSAPSRLPSEPAMPLIFNTRFLAIHENIYCATSKLSEKCVIAVRTADDE